MCRNRLYAAVCLSILMCALEGFSPQQQIPVPPVIKISGVLKNSNGQPPMGSLRIAFSLHESQEEGEPLWAYRSFKRVFCLVVLGSGCIGSSGH